MTRRQICLCMALALWVSFAGAQQPTTTPEPKSSSTQVAMAPGKLKAASLNLVPYPAKKQSSAQQTKDDTECFDWTKQSTGIDLSQPVAVAQNANPSSPQKNERLRGAARGAAVGAIAGEVIDDKGGEGAAVGAAAGAARSGKKQRTEAEQAQKESDAAAQSAQAERLETFRKGYTACMEARGYTIK